MAIKIPEWDEVQSPVEDGTANALEKFIYHNEPAGRVEEENFRAQLYALIEYIEGQRWCAKCTKPLTAASYCRECWLEEDV